MAYFIEANVRSEQFSVITDVIEGKPLELFVNLQTDKALAELEEGLRSLLQGKQEKYDFIDEHTKMFADKEKATVQSFVNPEKKEPEVGEYPTMEVYKLICRLNSLIKSTRQMWSGSKKIFDFKADLKRKMDLVSPSEGMKK